MKKHARFISGLLTIILLSSTPSYAWNNRGHMMVAGVAYNKLSSQTKDRVNELLLLNPDVNNWLDLIPSATSEAQKKMMLFVIAATWTDRIKSDPDYVTDGTHNGNRPPNTPQAGQNIGFDDTFRHKYWHFVDMPFSKDGTALPPVPTPNALTQMEKFRAIFGSATASDELKSYDLSWFLHLIGDVHQPLHATTRVTAAHKDGDDGGNGVKLASPSNLHSFWDGVLGSGESLLPMTTAISMLPTAPARAGK